jgi:hypothetical protein
MPLLGPTFSLRGDGRVGFGCLAALWAVAVTTVPAAGRERLR